MGVPGAVSPIEGYLKNKILKQNEKVTYRNDGYRFYRWMAEAISLLKRATSTVILLSLKAPE